MDAGAFGCRLGPADAYRFAKGEEVTASSGQRARLARPLDFIVVTDHSDGFGFFPQLLGGDPEMLAYPQGRKWYDMINSGQGAPRQWRSSRIFARGLLPKAYCPFPGTPAYRWRGEETIKAADEANDPGQFHRFHRLRVDFDHRGKQSSSQCHLPGEWALGGQVEPYTTQKPLGSDNPRDLWKWMAAFEQKTGGNVLASPITAI